MLRRILFRLIELSISICVGLQVMQFAIWMKVDNSFSLAAAMVSMVCSSAFIRFSNKIRY